MNGIASPYQQVSTRFCPAYWTNLRYNGEAVSLALYHGKMWEPLIWEMAIYGSFWDSRDETMKHNELPTKYTDIYNTRI